MIADPGSWYTFIPGNSFLLGKSVPIFSIDMILGCLTFHLDDGSEERVIAFCVLRAWDPGDKPQSGGKRWTSQPTPVET